MTIVNFFAWMSIATSWKDLPEAQPLLRCEPVKFWYRTSATKAGGQVRRGLARQDSLLRIIVTV